MRADDLSDRGDDDHDGDFVGCLAGNLRAASRIVNRVYDEALRDTGLRITQVALLAQVRRRQPVTVTELAAVLAAERSAVARDLRVLERDGLVTVSVKAADQRAREVTLTPLGAARLSAAAPPWREAQAEMRRRIGWDRVSETVDRVAELVEELMRE